MLRCFVIQPFNQLFTKRFHDIYKPSITDCGLEAYRVDYDFSVNVPIESIEQEIKNSSVVLADITTDNPNVWYELGFAYALRKPVVMICSDERTSQKYPFDIQHRTVIPYQVQSTQDFAALQKNITARINALLKGIETLDAVSENDGAIAPTDGLTQPELAVIAAAVGSVTLPDQPIPAYSLKNDTERAGFTSFAFSLGVKRLLKKSFIKISKHSDFDSEPYDAIQLTAPAWDWIESNETKFLLKREKPNRLVTTYKPKKEIRDIDF